MNGSTGDGSGLIGRLLEHFDKMADRPDISGETGALYWRERILYMSLFAGVGLAIFAFIPSLVLLVYEKKWVLLSVSSLLYVMAILMMRLQDLRFEWRAAGTSLILYLMGVGIIVYRGPFTGGPVWLYIFGLSAGIFLGLRAAIASLAINAVTLIAVGLCAYAGVLSWKPAALNPVLNWSIACVMFVTLNAMGAVAVSALLEGLNSSLLKLKETNAALKREVEERKRAEETIRESEKRFRETVDLLPSIVCEYDLDGRITYVNNYGLDVFGYTREDVEQGVHAAQMLPPEEVPKYRERFTAVREGSGVEPVEYRLKCKDGSTVDVIANSAPIYKDGNIVGSRSSITPVTELKQIQEALRESEERYRLLAENVTDVIWTRDLNLRLTYISPSIKKQQGYTVEEAMARKLEEHMPPASLKIIGDVLVEELEIEKSEQKDLSRSRTIELELICKDGSTIWTEAKVGFLRDRHGNPVGIIGVTRDISKRKKMENAFQKSEAKYRLLIDSLPNIVFRGYKDGSVEFIDDKIESLTGYKKEAFNTRRINWLDLVLEEDRKKIRQTFIAALKGNKTYVREYRIKSKPGETIYLQEGSQIVCDENGEIEFVAGAFIDVTRHKKLESQLQQLDRIESVGTLAGGLAHDFNNLLMGIQGRTSLVLMDSGLSPRHREHLKGIEDYVKSATDITKQLLGFARGAKHEFKTTDLNELVKNQNHMFGRTRKEIVIREKYEKNLWTVDVDQGQIEQVLLNIYVNAWQAMPGGGVLYIETENTLMGEDDSTPFPVAPGKYVKISITDTGVGMDEATRRRIFDPFFTTKGFERGTGLGLASAFSIIQNHGGFIDVFSEKGKGSTFTIFLPASGKKAIEKMISAEEPIRGAETLLLVDDEDMILEIGREFLKTLGYTVLTAKNGKEALRTYEQIRDGIDMVILDMIMPEMGGGETYDRLKEINPGIKVLLASGYSIDGQATEILEKGCDGFIQKPFNMTALSKKIREILDKVG